ncbi:MAG: outer membrane beta-barrel protein [Candidatus Aminicenantes bacterium]|nr:outer membrane beta-barrel protein [Candidatus Aminicenantes bacterium]
MNEIYGGEDVIYGLKIGVHIWQGFYVFLSGMQYAQVGETLLGDITRLRLNPIDVSLRYTFAFGSVNPYLESGFTYIYFIEKSDIGDTKNRGSGFSVDGGIEFKLSRRFILDVGVKYSQVKVSPGGFDVQLGGFQGGVSFLVIF